MMSKGFCSRVAGLIAASFVATGVARADDTGGPAAAPEKEPGPRAVSVSAARRAGPIAIDGVLGESAWNAASPRNAFWQREPFEGKPPRFKTEFRVLYDERALYVGVRAFDPNPGRIRGLLTRRDQDSISDWILVGIDSYHDKRTAFVFGVNPAGVQWDFLVFNDAQEDRSWDAVWESGSKIDDKGWVAEFRIPYNQLRFARAKEQRWGLQVLRVVSRINETSAWSPWPKASSQIVSLFGTLDGIRDIKPSLRLELLPYTTGGAVLSDADPDDPFANDLDGKGGLGLDVKYGLGSNLTLSGTINPDFGQVEADPSEVNLSAYETFFPEKRPFFLEGAEIFGYGLGHDDSNTEKLFYSRRVGAAPHRVPDEAYDPCWHADPEDPTGRQLFLGYYGPDYLDAPDATTIYTAAKVSGKTRSGWSIGVLDAMTGKEKASEYYLDEAQDLCGMEPGQRTRVVEPFTNYGVLRVRKDIYEGRTVFGGALTTVNRRLDGTGIDWLHDQAYTGGLELSHRFGHDLWMVDVRLAGSYVHGAPTAIDITQRSSSRYYHRPDAAHLDYDPTRTHLEGAALVWTVGKFDGDDWRAGVGGDMRTPGFEVNDLGFQHHVDKWVGWAWGQYRDDEPGKTLLSYQVNSSVWGALGRSPSHVSHGGDLNLNATLRSYWGGHMRLGFNRLLLDTRALRGGPALRVNSGYSVSMGMWSDPRKRVRGSLSGHTSGSPASDSWSWSVSPSVTVQARSNLDISVGPAFSVAVNDSQYVAEAEECMAVDALDCYVVDPPTESHYVLGRLRQRVASLTMRLNYTFSPRISLQVYAQPFIFAARYSDYKEADQPRARDYEERFHEFTQAETRIDEYDQYLVDRDLDGNPDFAFELADINFRQLRSNVVFRWEYRPGSTLFVIWSHERTSDVADGRFRFAHDLGELVGETGEHRVMLKLNYWMGA